MASESEGPPVSWVAIAVLVALPVVAGGSLSFLFETGPVHRLGLFLVGAGVIVGVVTLLLRASG